MAGPIKISVLADVGKAVKDVTHFSDVVEEETHRVVTGLGDPKLTGGFGKVQEGFDVADTRAMGFADTITGVQDSMTALQGMFGQGSAASATFGDKLLMLAQGTSDLMSGFANFIVPLAAVGSSMNTLSLATIRSTIATGAHKVASIAAAGASKVWAAGQWLLNAALTANPIGLVIVAIAALVAIVIIAWKRSETFRAIVTGAFRGVLAAASAVWNWLRGNWPLLLAILTGPIGLAVRWIVQHWDQIIATARALPGKIRGVFGSIGNLLIDAGRRLIQGFINGITGMFGSVQRKLGELTSKLTSWKGPAGRDRRLLYGSGQLVVGGFIDGLESRYGTVRDSLGGLTSSLGADVGGAIRVGGAPEPSWARQLREAIGAGFTLRLESGTRTDDVLLGLLQERVAAKGGLKRVFVP